MDFLLTCTYPVLYKVPAGLLPSFGPGLALYLHPSRCGYGVAPRRTVALRLRLGPPTWREVSMASYLIRITINGPNSNHDLFVRAFVLERNDPGKLETEIHDVINSLKKAPEVPNA